MMENKIICERGRAVAIEVAAALLSMFHCNCCSRSYYTGDV
jgi:hypothetical protein